jgi:hypothetical protein
MPETIAGAGFSILLGMGAIVSAWGGYWIYTRRRTRGGVMIAVGVLMMLAGPVGLGWFKAPLIGQAVAVTIVIGVIASGAEFWVRSQRGQTPIRQQPESAGPAGQPPPVTSRTHDPHSLALVDGPESENHEATKATTAVGRKTPSRTPRRRSSARAVRKSP